MVCLLYLYSFLSGSCEQSVVIGSLFDPKGFSLDPGAFRLKVARAGFKLYYSKNRFARAFSLDPGAFSLDPGAFSFDPGAFSPDPIEGSACGGSGCRLLTRVRTVLFFITKCAPYGLTTPRYIKKAFLEGLEPSIS